MRMDDEALAERTIAALQARLDEAEEKIAYLRGGCLKLDRDELIQRITAIGPERWKARSWLAEQLEPWRVENVLLRERLEAEGISLHVEPA